MNKLNSLSLKDKARNITRSNYFFSIITILLIAFLVLSFFLAITLGTVGINILDTYKVFIGKLFNIPSLFARSTLGTLISQIIYIWDLLTSANKLGILNNLPINTL